MLTASERFDLAAPQYAANALKSSYLLQADEFIAKDFRPAVRLQLVALKAAHDMTLALNPLFKDGSATGPVTSKREGELSVGFAAPSSSAIDDGEYALTKYGRKLLELLRSSKLLAMTA
jgi:hypothetical protein